MDLHGDPLVGVPDPVADDLRADAAVQRERGVPPRWSGSDAMAEPNVAVLRDGMRVSPPAGRLGRSPWSAAAVGAGCLAESSAEGVDEGAGRGPAAAVGDRGDWLAVGRVRAQRSADCPCPAPRRHGRAVGAVPAAGGRAPGRSGFPCTVGSDAAALGRQPGPRASRSAPTTPTRCSARSRRRAPPSTTRLSPGFRAARSRR